MSTYIRPECEKQVKGVIGAKFKKFPTLPEAEEFVKNGPKVYTKPPPRTSAASTSASKSTNITTTTTTTTSASSSSAALSILGAKSSFTRINGITVPSGSDTLVIYTDGSARGNGKLGSQAGLGVFFGVNDPRNLSERLQGEQTNQRAEIMVRSGITLCSILL